MKQKIQQLLAEILEDLGVQGAGIAVEIPQNPQHGDYATNSAMLLAGRLKEPPMKIALQIVDSIKKHQKESGQEKLDWLEKAEVAPPGFINLWLSRKYFGNQLEEALKEKEHYGMIKNPVNRSLFKTKSSHSPLSLLSSDKPTGKEGKGKTIMVEFAHPNTHKAFHIGHLRNITTGESIIRLLEAVGYTVVRVNYQGDVGMHIAKALYALLEVSTYKEDVKSMTGIKQRVEFLGKAYAAGSSAFEDDPKAKAMIIDLNALIYACAQRYAKEVGRDPGTTDYLALVKNHVHPLETVYDLWKETRQWSLDYFESVYKRVGTRYDRLYFESECLAGVDISKQAVKKGILQESDGAIIFDGKPYGTDTRVFVNSLGLPTYEGKELKLATIQAKEHPGIAHLIHVLGPEQVSFTKVTFKAQELLGIFRAGVQHHLTYGWVKLKQGKMSSRSGNVVLGEWLLDEAKKEVFKILHQNKSNYTKEEQEKIAESAAVAAVKYAFLKVGTNQEIAFDLKESVSFEGDSGPYLLYTNARCRSVIRKSSDLSNLGILSDLSLNPEERTVARRIVQFSEVVADSATRFTPNILCTYLFHLAQEFNVLYAKHEILGQSHRLALTAATAQVLKNGLFLLGIPTVERM